MSSHTVVGRSESVVDEIITMDGARSGGHFLHCVGVSLEHGWCMALAYLMPDAQTSYDLLRMILDPLIVS